MSDPYVLELEALARLRRIRRPGQPSTLVKVLRMFLASAPGDLALLETSMEACDWSAVERTAHSLKGAAALLGASQLSSLCAELELQARSGGGPDAQRALGRLREQSDRWRVALERTLERELEADVPC